MPGSLGHEFQDAKTFASWVLHIVLFSSSFPLELWYLVQLNKWNKWFFWSITGYWLFEVW